LECFVENFAGEQEEGMVNYLLREANYVWKNYLNLSVQEELASHMFDKYIAKVRSTTSSSLRTNILN